MSKKSFYIRHQNHQQNNSALDLSLKRSNACAEKEVPSALGDAASNKKLAGALWEAASDKHLTSALEDASTDLKLPSALWDVGLSWRMHGALDDSFQSSRMHGALRSAHSSTRYPRELLDALSDETFSNASVRFLNDLSSGKFYNRLWNRSNVPSNSEFSQARRQHSNNMIKNFLLEESEKQLTTVCFEDSSPFHFSASPSRADTQIPIVFPLFKDNSRVNFHSTSPINICNYAFIHQVPEDAELSSSPFYNAGGYKKLSIKGNLAENFQNYCKTSGYFNKFTPSFEEMENNVGGDDDDEEREMKLEAQAIKMKSYWLNKMESNLNGEQSCCSLSKVIGEFESQGEFVPTSQSSTSLPYIGRFKHDDGENVLTTTDSQDVRRCTLKAKRSAKIRAIRRHRNYISDQYCYENCCHLPNETAISAKHSACGNWGIALSNNWIAIGKDVIVDVFDRVLDNEAT